MKILCMCNFKRLNKCCACPHSKTLCQFAVLWRQQFFSGSGSLFSVGYVDPDPTV
jgi:hypothetical protein